MAEMLSLGFMQRAILAGLLIGLLCSAVSFFVYLKRLSFAGVGISHSALGGLAIGLLTNTNPVFVAAIFSTLVAWGTGATSRRGEVHEDAAIGIFFSSAMALGVALIGMYRGYAADLFSFLFGNILAVTVSDLWILAVVAAVVLAAITLLFKDLIALCFDEEVACASGLPVSALYYTLLTIIAVTVVVSVKVVGVVLASALLVIPAATGFELAGNYRGMIVVAILAGILSSLGGLWLSYALDLASGATIVLLASAMFFLTLAFSPRRRAVRRQRLAVPRQVPATHPIPADRSNQKPARPD